jgi:hypothetical protein
VCKYTFSHYPIIPIHLLYKKVTLYSRYFDGHRISFNWLVVVRSAEFLKCTLAKRFADVFLLCWFGEISNEAGGHLKNSELLVFDTCRRHFCGQGDLLINCNFQLCRSPLPLCLLEICLVSSGSLLSLCLRNASPEIRLVSSREPICN